MEASYSHFFIGLDFNCSRGIFWWSLSLAFVVSDLRDPSPSQIHGTSSRFSWTSRRFSRESTFYLYFVKVESGFSRNSPVSGRSPTETYESLRILTDPRSQLQSGSASEPTSARVIYKFELLFRGIAIAFRLFLPCFTDFYRLFGLSWDSLATCYSKDRMEEILVQLYD